MTKDACIEIDSDSQSEGSRQQSNELDEDFLVLGDNDDESDEEDVSNGELDNRSETGTDLPPWMNHYVDYRRVNYLVALHNEIVAFCKLMEPREEEMKQRRDLVDRFTTLVKSTFEGCQVEVFGSQATGLCLPTSDIDIAIQLSDSDTETMQREVESDEKKKKEEELAEMENWDVPTGHPLHRLEEALRKEWLSELSYLEVIENTRVPLVKFTHQPSNISVDVCFNQTSGCKAAKVRSSVHPFHFVPYIHMILNPTCGPIHSSCTSTWMHSLL